MKLTMLLLQARPAAEPVDDGGIFQFIWDFIDTPAPYSPMTEYLLVLFILWLLARRANRKQSFDNQAQDVLDQKYASGEISKKAYEKFRQDVSLRPKR